MDIKHEYDMCKIEKEYIKFCLLLVLIGKGIYSSFKICIINAVYTFQSV